MFEYMINRLILYCISLFITQNVLAQGVLVLGVAQDAGHPQANCAKSCCSEAFEDPSKSHKVSSIAISDGERFYIIDATPDFTSQLDKAKEVFANQTFGGIILTHAHIGHYTGLMYLGREAMNASSIPVYTLPKMKAFLENNGPWSQLVALNNIQLIEMQNGEEFEVSENISITPILVPHRDEFSETAGYSIDINDKEILFIPDIDKWERWDKDILRLIDGCNYAFLDATFYNGQELPGRNINEVPHPFVIESMKLFDQLSAIDKKKVHFIHFNHTNPLLDDKSQEFELIIHEKFNVAYEGLILSLD